MFSLIFDNRSNNDAIWIGNVFCEPQHRTPIGNFQQGGAIEVNTVIDGVALTELDGNTGFNIPLPHGSLPNDCGDVYLIPIPVKDGGTVTITYRE